MKEFFKKFSGFFEHIPALIVKGRYIFILLFIGLTIFGLCMISKTNVVYDLTGYLPDGCDATEAMAVLQEEFDDKGMTYVCVRDISKDEAQNIQKKLSEIDGVDTITYIESTNYKNGNALYTVSLKDYDSTTGAFNTVEKIINTLSTEDAYLSGQSAYSYFTKLETEESMITLGVAIVVIILLIMLFTSKTYFEIIILILVFGVSMGINIGTNFLFSKISYISNLVALVLQLALSLDYSIILLRRFMEERSNGLEAKEAVEVALKKGMPEILSSSLTTVAGLAALTLMVLKIGAEIGLSLAKGIFISMLTVMLFMPALLIIFDKPLEKSKHKNFVPNVTKISRKVLKARYVIVPIFCVLIILAGVGQSYNKYSFNYNGGSKIVSGQTAIKDAGFGTLNTFVVMVEKGDAEKERELIKYINSFDVVDENETTALSNINLYSFMGDTEHELYLTDEMGYDDLMALLNPLVEGTSYQTIVSNLCTSIFNGYLENNNIEDESEKVRLIDLLDYIVTYVVCDENGEVLPMYQALLTIDGVDYSEYLSQLAYAKNNLESDNMSRMTFTLKTGVEDDETFAFIKEVKENIGTYFDTHYVMGESVVCYEMSLYFDQDNMRVILCTIGFILLILLFTFRNVSLPIILILAIQGGIFINFAIPFLAGNSICFIGYLIISAVQMGATIDYAIVLTNRYETTKGNYDNKLDAMAESENAVFTTVITSGVILTLTGFVLSVLSSGVVAQLGLLLGIGTSISMIIVLFVLPSMLIISDKLIDRTFFKKLIKKK